MDMAQTEVPLPMTPSGEWGNLMQESIYHPVFARHRYRVNPPYVCPAVRVTPGINGVGYAVFPLSTFELGEVWTTDEELSTWDLEVVEGGWGRAEIVFHPLVTYPLTLLRTLLDVLRHQRYSDGSALGWTSWPAACRRPSKLITVVGSCRRCAQLRYLAPRALLTAPKMVPAWQCDLIGAQCYRPNPENIFDVTPDQWLALAQYREVKAPVITLPTAQPSIELATLKDGDSGKEVRRSGVQAASGGVKSTPLRPVKPEDVKWEFHDDPEDIAELSAAVAEENNYCFRPDEESGTSRYHTWTDCPRRRENPAELQAELRLIAGQLAKNLDAPDPTREDVARFAQARDCGSLKAHQQMFLKWADTHKEAYFEGKDDIGTFNEWRETVNFYFSRVAEHNVTTQAWLATATFRKTALRWWGIKLRNTILLWYSHSNNCSSGYGSNLYRRRVPTKRWAPGKSSPIEAPSKIISSSWIL